MLKDPWGFSYVTEQQFGWIWHLNKGAVCYRKGSVHFGFEWGLLCSGVGGFGVVFREVETPILPIFLYNTQGDRERERGISLILAGNSSYTGRLWCCMCSCQPTVGLIILSLSKIFFFAPKTFSICIKSSLTWAFKCR